MFPFGAIGAWSKAQRTSCGRHSGYTCLSGFFPRVSKKQLLFCSLQTVFFLLEVFHHEFPSRGKPQQPHPKMTTIGTESFKVTLITLATSTGLNSGASVFSARLSSCSAPGATAVGTLDLGHPTHALPKRVAKS